MLNPPNDSSCACMVCDAGACVCVPASIGTVTATHGIGVCAAGGSGAILAGLGIGLAAWGLANCGFFSAKAHCEKQDQQAKMPLIAQDHPQSAPSFTKMKP